MRYVPPRPPPGPRGKGKRKVESVEERRARKRQNGRPEPAEDDHDDPRQLVADTITVPGVPPIPRPMHHQERDSGRSPGLDHRSTGPLDVERLAITNSRTAGVRVIGATATLNDISVVGVDAADDWGGIGVVLALGAVVQGSRWDIRDTQQAGVLVAGADTTLEDVAVAEVAPLTCERCPDESAAAGFATVAFGSSEAALRLTRGLVTEAACVAFHHGAGALTVDTFAVQGAAAGFYTAAPEDLSLRRGDFGEVSAEGATDVPPAPVVPVDDE